MNDLVKAMDVYTIRKHFDAVCKEAILEAGRFLQGGERDSPLEINRAPCYNVEKYTVSLRCVRAGGKERERP